MAKIQTGEQPQIFQIKKFLGINDGTDGDTQLRMGEAAEMRNWKITKDGSLQIRPGTDSVFTFTGAVRGTWYGFVDGVQRLIIVADNNFWLVNMSANPWTKTSIGTMTDDAHTEFFGYSDKLYAMNGHQYMVWDGDTTHTFSNVVGYVPVVAVSRTPSGSESTEYEQVNKLTAKRKVWFSPDGSAATFSLPEKKLESVDAAIDRTTGLEIVKFGTITTEVSGLTFTVTSESTLLSFMRSHKGFCYAGQFQLNYQHLSANQKWLLFPSKDGDWLEVTLDELGITLTGTPATDNQANFTLVNAWTANASAGTVTFDSAPLVGVNSIEVEYTIPPIVLEKEPTSVPAALTPRFSNEETFRNHMKYLASYKQDNGLYSPGNFYIYISDVSGDVIHVSVRNLTTDSVSADTVLSALGITLYTTPSAGDRILLKVSPSGAYTNKRQICGMRFFETFNGNNDNRVFLYGDNTNQCVYSGIERTEVGGNPTAEYFPDLNVLGVGEENTPITALVRHLSRMLAFKPSATYSISYGTVTQESGSVIAAFYVTPVNRIIGNVAPGQVKLVLNNPRSLHESSLYSWKASSSSGYLTSDERQAKRISDRITNTLSNLDISNCLVFDDEYAQEYYIIDPVSEKALVNNYAADAWYIYTDFPVTSLVRVSDELYLGTTEGKFVHFSRDYTSDDSAAIDAFWRSGSLAFSKDWKKKYTSKIFVSMLPESNARVIVTARTNKQSSYDDRILAYSTDLEDYVMAYGLSTFTHMNFAQFSFGTNRQPQTKRIRIKIKKYTYFQLIFKSNSASNTATIVGTDIDVRYSGDVK